MKRSRSFWFAVGLAFTIASPATAKHPVRPGEEQTKIDFLVGEVRNSPAIFIRNGREYTASRAASHLSTKLKFAGRRVQNARQFVIGIASHSEETGKPYEIRWPDGRRQPLAEWLLARLELYEKEHLRTSGRRRVREL
jgi:hypothetical protein